ncbi:CAAX amino terminal protease self- immunity [Candidatus Ornithobacterium hominis]|uniref:CAAX amino terminal protease self- immunity n=1 Tax=Candidatus Ornithobacterium hominis TaxID=2497989 RepID=A0A383U350_9FLAO|nr:CAAX amino terminal protease self- immunity [Candidatus Ornithobacterium hominis]SZD73908.1 CAAX amino terminal protease self- immunity [Candidatus Ornithobacterium hominis]
MKEFIRFIFTGEVLQQDSSFLRNMLEVLLGYGKVMFIYLLIVALGVLIFNITSSTSTAMVRHNDTNFYYRILLICIIVPIIEEFAFRLILNVNKINIIVGGLSLIFCIGTFINSYINTNKYVLMAIILCIGIYVILSNYESIVFFIVRNKFVIIHFLTILFCLFHYKNHNFNSDLLGILLLMFMTLLLGYYFTFVRLKFGFAYSVMIHIIHNTLISLPFIINNIIKMR